MIEPMKPKQTFQQAEIQDGDIICFQEDLSSAQLVASMQGLAVTNQPERIAELQNGNAGAIADAKEFYEYLANKVTVIFSPRYNDSELPKFELDLNKKITYDQVRGFQRLMTRQDTDEPYSSPRELPTSSRSHPPTSASQP
jgi:ubiquitin carboxyl-terminal hydrolase 7